MKKCKSCNKDKELSEFHKHTIAPDGLRYSCKPCRRMEAQLYNRDRPKSEASKKWRKNNHDKFIAQSRRTYKRNPHKYSARRAVRDALRNNTLVKPSHCCINTERCNGSIDGHHPNYTKPLEVQWLCRTHHLAWHKLFTTEDA